MFMRFQREKTMKARRSSLFNLDDADDTDIFTHKGRALGAANMLDTDGHSDDDDDDAALGKEVVRLVLLSPQ
jgi:hypothetical protein